MAASNNKVAADNQLGFINLNQSNRLGYKIEEGRKDFSTSRYKIFGPDHIVNNFFTFSEYKPDLKPDQSSQTLAFTEADATKLSQNRLMHQGSIYLEVESKIADQMQALRKEYSSTVEEPTKKKLTKQIKELTLSIHQLRLVKLSLLPIDINKYNNCRNIIVMGESGAGKSSLINIMMNENVIKLSHGVLLSDTIACDVYDSYMTIEKKLIRYVDTIGFVDSIMKNDVIHINKHYSSFLEHCNCIIFVISAARMYDTTVKGILETTQLFKAVPKLLIITHCPKEQAQTRVSELFSFPFIKDHFNVHNTYCYDIPNLEFQIKYLDEQVRSRYQGRQGKAIWKERCKQAEEKIRNTALDQLRIRALVQAQIITNFHKTVNVTLNESQKVKLLDKFSHE